MQKKFSTRLYIFQTPLCLSKAITASNLNHQCFATSGTSGYVVSENTGVVGIDLNTPSPDKHNNITNNFKALKIDFIFKTKKLPT